MHARPGRLIHVICNITVAFLIGSVLNPLAPWRENFPKIPERRVKVQKQGHLTNGGAFICRNMIG